MSFVETKYHHLHSCCVTVCCSECTRTSNDAYFSAIIIGFVRLVSSLLLSKLLQKYRRRFMYFVSASATILSLVSFATCNFFINKLPKTQNQSIIGYRLLSDAQNQGMILEDITNNLSTHR